MGREAGRLKAQAAESDAIEGEVLQKISDKVSQAEEVQFMKELTVIKRDMGKLVHGIRQQVTDAMNDAARQVDRDPIKSGVHVAPTVIEDDLTYSTSSAPSSEQ